MTVGTSDSRGKKDIVLIGGFRLCSNVVGSENDLDGSRVLKMCGRGKDLSLQSSEDRQSRWVRPRRES